jgi:FlaA1/EpsC-like NDP-sugar epimerase
LLDDLRVAVARLPRVWKRLTLIVFDIIALSAALYLAYAFRIGLWSPPANLSTVAIMLTAPIVAIPVFIRMGLYRSVIRYLPEKALWTILQAMTFAVVWWVVVAFLTELAVHGLVPRSVPILYWLFGTVFITGSRFFAKALLGASSKMSLTRRPVVIYGAGEAGVQLAQALGRQRSRFIVGFLDDNAGLVGHDVAGIRVYAPSHLSVLKEQFGVTEVILSIPSLGLARRQEIVNSVSGHGIKIRTVPALAAMAQGKFLADDIREVDIDELVGRSVVPPDTELFRQVISGRTVMVTGAGGSIGSELCKLVARLEPRRLVLFEANEFALYQIDRALGALPGLDRIAVLGSVTDASRVERAIVENGVEVVYHAAAHKHVPLVEANALEGIRNNVLGTATVADIALNTGVEHFVLISSDKAVHPTNVMGATKRWAELIVWQKQLGADRTNSGQRFSAVRFGNVLGSNGSVVPLFAEQIANGGPVTLTDTRMTRYFMSIHEAAELIVQASALSTGGDVFLLEMGNPIRVRELAENMIRLAGYTIRDNDNKDGDIEITVTGIRPGEKLSEELFYDKAKSSPTRHPKILRGVRRDVSSIGDVDGALDRMKTLLAAQDEAGARKLLFEFIGAQSTE